MFRRWFWLALMFAVLPRLAIHAQPPAPATPLGSLTPDQARAALDTLNDPKKRAAFTATLEALVKGQQAPAPPPPAPAPADAAKAPAPEQPSLQLAPDSLGAQLLLTASAFLNQTADSVSEALRAAQSVPLLWAWVVVMVTNPIGQHLLAEAAWRLAIVLGLAGAVALTLHYLLRRPTARVFRRAAWRESPTPEEDAESRAERDETEPPPPRPRSVDGAGRRFVLGFALFALRMVPVLGLLVVGHAAAASRLGGSGQTRLIVLAVLDAIVASLTLLAVLGLLFQPDPPGMRLMPLRTTACAYLMRWGRRLILIAVPGYTLGEVGLLLGLSPPAHGALQKVVGLVLAICLAIIVVQRRRSVRRWLMAPSGATGVVSRLRNALARLWHWAALFLLAAAWLSWTLGAPGALAGTVRYFTLTVLVLIGAALARRALLALLAPFETATMPIDGAAPGSHALRDRLGVYHAAVQRLIRVGVGIVALLVLLQLYGIGGLNWLLTSEAGHRVASGFVTLLVTVILAFTVWEAANIAIESHLESLRREAQTARSARLRTLLPLIRTTLAITVAVVSGLMILSEIGVNIGPLLAGAGIVGVAIGFGSQKLVQDVITGVFLLLENTMQVGDVVKVGDMSGAVESLSVRTIRLRTEDGSVAVIPFSAVTTVTNMTRDYSRAVVAVNVSVDEDVDHAIDTMRAIVTEMRAEEAWSAIILDDLEVWGLDRFTDTALQIKARVMCTPFGRWSVSREFNRRLKQRFKVVPIATPFSALRLPAPEQQEVSTAASVSMSPARPMGQTGSG